MNITQLINSNINISSDVLVLQRYCEKLVVSWNYNFYIIVNFALLMIMFINYKTHFVKKVDLDPARFDMIISIILLVFNTCMFLFQFLVKPLEILLVGA